MELSTAIINGSKLRGKTQGAFFYPETDEVCSCALGAAYEAYTGQSYNNSKEADLNITIELQAIFPSLNKKVLHPSTGSYCCLQKAIIHLNDFTDMSREEIGEWVREMGY